MKTEPDNTDESNFPAHFGLFGLRGLMQDQMRKHSNDNSSKNTSFATKTWTEEKKYQGTVIELFSSPCNRLRMFFLDISDSQDSILWNQKNNFSTKWFSTS